jgi:transcriptional regulator with XRE-family HTH domain
MFMEDREISQARLAKETGIAKSAISEILSDKRPISLKYAGGLF